MGGQPDLSSWLVARLAVVKQQRGSAGREQSLAEDVH